MRLSSRQFEQKRIMMSSKNKIYSTSCLRRRVLKECFNILTEKGFRDESLERERIMLRSDQTYQNIRNLSGSILSHEYLHVLDAFNVKS